VKHSDLRSKDFIQEHGSDCAEVDAPPPSELRRRVEAAIKWHIDPERWRRLLEVERLEKETLAEVSRGWGEEKADLD
jgi:hypothetical protein